MSIYINFIAEFLAAHKEVKDYASWVKARAKRKEKSRTRRSI